MKYFFVIIFILTSCNLDLDKPEVLDRIRGLGCKLSPLIISPSPETSTNKITITLYAAIPVDENITLSYFPDPGAISSFMLNENEIIFDSTTDTYTSYEGIKLFTTNFIADVPSNKLFIKNGMLAPGKVKYGVSLTGSSKTENIIGNFLVYPEGSSELSWSNPEIKISGPEEDILAGSKVLLKADITNFNDEEVKISWFVSSGSITNRRSTETYWNSPSIPGSYTVIGTVRGRSSFGFGIDIITLEVK